MPFTSFVIFAEMRTGSNFLEASLNSFEDLHCYGEAFNPNFIGHQKTTELFGMDLAQRETAPLALIEKMKTQTDGLPGFRFFNDHDPRILAHVLGDPECAKVILTRNPLDSFVSLKIAAQTGQWKLTDAKQRREAKVRFEPQDFLQQLEEKRDFQHSVLKALQTSGQTAYYIAYEDLGDVDVLNGLAAYLGSAHQIAAASKTLKKQNPAELQEKVSNYAEMVAALGSIDHFNLNQTPNFEPRRGPGVPGYYTAATAPLLYIPLGAGPNLQALNWLAALDDVTPDALPTGLNQNALRQWKKAHPGHRSFAVLRHPVARAHHAFCSHILPNTDDRFHDIRRALSGKYKVEIPLNGDLSNYTIDDHKDAFLQFLEFLKANLAGQTSIRVDPAWATQTAQLEGAAQVVVPDMVIREEDAQAQLSHLAQSLGLKSAPFPPGQGSTPYDLSAIYDSRLEKLCAQAYRKDYINFGFSDWSES